MKSAKNDNSTIDAALKSMADDNELSVQINGDCMEPSLSNNSTVNIIRQRVYWPGDILLIRSVDGRLLTHRLLGFYPYRGAIRHITQADNAANTDIAILKTNIIGRVAHHTSDSTTFSARGKSFWRFVMFIAKRLMRKLRPDQ